MIEVSIGASGATAPIGVTGRDGEAALVNPAPFVAVSEHWYVTPPLRFLTVSGEPVPVTVRVGWPFAAHPAV